MKIIPFRRKEENLADKNKLIIFTDMDGVLTDGGMYFSSGGLIMKRFNTKDAAAILRLNAIGIPVILVTSASDPISIERAKSMAFEETFFGVEDKAKVVMEYCNMKQISLAQAVFVGDDAMDIEAMKLCGHSFCPYDAVMEVGYIATKILISAGGEGILAELASALLFPEAYNQWAADK